MFPFTIWRPSYVPRPTTAEQQAAHQAHLNEMKPVVLKNKDKK
jgi:hypothetical protein